MLVLNISKTITLLTTNGQNYDVVKVKESRNRYLGILMSIAKLTVSNPRQTLVVTTNENISLAELKSKFKEIWKDNEDLLELKSIIFVPREFAYAYLAGETLRELQKTGDYTGDSKTENPVVYELCSNDKMLIEYHKGKIKRYPLEKITKKEIEATIEESPVNVNKVVILAGEELNKMFFALQKSLSNPSMIIAGNEIIEEDNQICVDITESCLFSLTLLKSNKNLVRAIHILTKSMLYDTESSESKISTEEVICALVDEEDESSEAEEEVTSAQVDEEDGSNDAEEDLPDGDAFEEEELSEKDDFEKSLDKDEYLKEEDMLDEAEDPEEEELLGEESFDKTEDFEEEESFNENEEQLDETNPLEEEESFNETEDFEEQEDEPYEDFGEPFVEDIAEPFEDDTTEPLEEKDESFEDDISELFDKNEESSEDEFLEEQEEYFEEEFSGDFKESEEYFEEQEEESFEEESFKEEPAEDFEGPEESFEEGHTEDFEEQDESFDEEPVEDFEDSIEFFEEPEEKSFEEESTEDFVYPEEAVDDFVMKQEEAKKKKKALKKITSLESNDTKKKSLKRVESLVENTILEEPKMPKQELSEEKVEEIQPEVSVPKKKKSLKKVVLVPEVSNLQEEQETEFSEEFEKEESKKEVSNEEEVFTRHNSRLVTDMANEIEDILKPSTNERKTYKRVGAIEFADKFNLPQAPKKVKKKREDISYKETVEDANVSEDADCIIAEEFTNNGQTESESSKEFKVKKKQKVQATKSEKVAKQKKEPKPKQERKGLGLKLFGVVLVVVLAVLTVFSADIVISKKLQKATPTVELANLQQKIETVFADVESINKTHVALRNELDAIQSSDEQATLNYEELKELRVQYSGVIDVQSIESYKGTVIVKFTLHHGRFVTDGTVINSSIDITNEAQVEIVKAALGIPIDQLSNGSFTKDELLYSAETGVYTFVMYNEDTGLRG